MEYYHLTTPQKISGIFRDIIQTRQFQTSVEPFFIGKNVIAHYCRVPFVCLYIIRAAFNYASLRKKNRVNIFMKKMT